MSEQPTLADFILARVMEDEAVARAAMDRHSTDDAGHWEYVEYAYEGGSPQPLGSLQDTRIGTGYDPGFPWTDLVNRFDPARVLAECEAKRRIVALHSDEPEFGARGLHLCVDSMIDPDECATLHLLALSYADHPDYDEARRP